MVNENKIPAIVQVKFWKWRVFAGIVLVLLVILTYWGSLNNDFVDWDDFNYVVNNDLVRNTGSASVADIFNRPVSLNYHPLTILSLRLNNNTCSSCPDKISPAPFIRWNILIHIANTLLVFIFIFLLSDKNLFVSFFVAMVFGIHPMHVESVAWISERKDLLYTFFFIAGLIAYAEYRKRTEKARASVSWLFISFVLFVLSCLSKAMAVVFPLVLILIDYWMIKPGPGEPVWQQIKKIVSHKRVLYLIPFFIVSLFFGIMAFRIQEGKNFLQLFDPKYISSAAINEFGTFSLWQRVQFAGYGFTGYILKFILPINLSAIYPYPTIQEYSYGLFSIILKLAPAGFLLIAGLSLYSVRKTKLFVFGIGFYFVTIFMVIQFISVGTALMADRYSYLSYIGLSFILAINIHRFFSTRKYLLLISLIVVAIPLIILSSRQVKVWENSETLWTRVIELHPTVERAWRGRGKYYSRMADLTSDKKEKSGFNGRAFFDFKQAIKLGTKQPDIFEGLGCIYGNYGDNMNAIDCFNKALEIDSGRGNGFFNRAIALSNIKMPDAAITDYTHALKLIPGKELQIRSNRYILYLSTGRFHEAVADLDYLLGKDARNPTLFYNRALAKEQYGDISGAVTDFKMALELQPGDQEIKNQLKKLAGK